MRWHLGMLATSQSCSIRYAEGLLSTWFGGRCLGHVDRKMLLRACLPLTGLLSMSLLAKCFVPTLSSNSRLLTSVIADWRARAGEHYTSSLVHRLIGTSRDGIPARSTWQLRFER